MRLVARLLIALAAFTSSQAVARDDRIALPVKDAMAVQTQLNGDIRFYWKGQKTPPVEHRYGRAQTNKKTRALGRTDKQACEWVWQSAMIALQNKARSLGANAVINIVSNYKGQLFESANSYQCGVGGIIAGVVLKGDFVNLAK